MLRFAFSAFVVAFLCTPTALGQVITICSVPIERSCFYAAGSVPCGEHFCNTTVFIPRCTADEGLEVDPWILRKVKSLRNAEENEEGYTNWNQQSWTDRCGLKYSCECDETPGTFDPCVKVGNGTAYHPIDWLPSGPKNCVGDGL